MQISRKAITMARTRRSDDDDGNFLPGALGDAAMVDNLKMNMRTKNRQLTLDTQVDDRAINIVYQIEQWNREDDESEENLKEFVRPTITLFIHSPGGEVTAGMAVVSAIQQSVTPVMTVCVGMAASMAFLIFISGHIRYSYRNAEFMLHQLSHASWGKLMDMYETVLQDLKLQERIDCIILDRTDITKEQLSNNRERKQDWYMFADEAMELGVADGVMAKGITVKKEDPPKPSLKGLNVGFSGSFLGYTLSKLAEEHEFTLVGWNSEELDVLVLGAGAPQDALDKEGVEGITTITKDQFEDIITTPDEPEEEKVEDGEEVS